MHQPRVAAIILNWNGREIIGKCLSSVTASTYRPLDVIVVDNGSTDGSVAFIYQEFPSVHVIECKENNGFARGNNIGIEYALGQNSDFVFILNNDTVLAADCIENLVERALADSRIGAVSPRILFFEPSDRIWSAGGSYNLWRGVARHYGLRGQSDDPQWNQPREITFATGCAALLRAQALRQVGLFDESLFIYNEDSELSLRLCNAGWKIFYEPRAVLWHLEKYTMSRLSGNRRTIHLCVRNLLRIHAKHGRWYHKITFYPYFVWRWIILSGGNAFFHRRWDVLQGIFQGIVAYMRRETGNPS